MLERKNGKKRSKSFFFLDLPLVSLALRTGHRRSGFPTEGAFFPFALFIYWANEYVGMYCMYSLAHVCTCTCIHTLIIGQSQYITLPPWPTT